MSGEKKKRERASGFVMISPPFFSYNKTMTFYLNDDRFTLVVRAS